MLRNVESRFATQPSVNIPRTRMRIPHRYTTTFNVGDLIPTFCTEIIPGSSHRVKSHKVVRTQPMVSAPMDDLYLDTYYFFVPNRLVWNHWKEFMGENTSAPWVPQVTYTIPQLETFHDPGAGNFSLKPGTLADYFGLPMNPISASTGDYLSVSALYFRAYALIVREFFQDQNLETPLNVPLDDTTRRLVDNTYSNSTLKSNYVNYTALGGLPYVVNKFHDYFTSALPSPVKSATDLLAFPDMPVIWNPDNTVDKNKFYPNGISALNPGTWMTGTGDKSGYPDFNNSTTGAEEPGIPLNYYAFSATTLHDLRVAFAIDRLLQRDAIGGTRYREMLRAHFSVTSPDASMQVPQYLGGSRIPLQITQVLQTSESGNTPQGNVAGYSLTADSHFDFDGSFTEHGMIIGLQCVRYKNSYQQGIHRRFTRKNRLDFYFPEFARLDSQAILKKEIYADGSSNDNDVFGYQEYAADYRYHPDVITGEMRSGISNTLDSWHFADYYSQAPTLSRDWMMVDKSNVDRALAVSSSVSNQLWCNILFEDDATLPMPLYSIPDLIGNF